MANTYESVVMYGSWLEVARSKLDENDVCTLMVQLMEYGLSGKIPNNDNEIMDVIFEMAKPNIDSNVRKKNAGKKGGRPSNNGAKTNGLSNENENANAYAYGNENDDAQPSASPSCPVTGAEGSASDVPDWMRDDFNA